MSILRDEKKSGRSKASYYGRAVAILPVVLFIILAMTMPKAVNAAVFNVSAGDTTGLINAINEANTNASSNTINLGVFAQRLEKVKFKKISDLGGFESDFEEVV